MSRTSFLLLSIGLISLISAGLLYKNLFSPPQTSPAEKQLFVVALSSDSQQIADKLQEQGLIRSKLAFLFLLKVKGVGKKIEPGGYMLTKDMNLWELTTGLLNSPQLKWVVIPEGLRKEEIGEKLAETLGWENQELEKWKTVYTRMEFDYLEGTYFPDTYLIPVDESGLEIAKRMTNHFNEKFSPYFEKSREQNIKWTTALKLASIIQREAAGKDDMPLIAGILWNRLLKDMKLEVDATVQYVRGKTQNGWWAPIIPEDKKIDSPFNTYLYPGLPPHPISNPGLPAIEAVLTPQETDCLYYLHDPQGEIHCAVNFEEHKENINKFLSTQLE